MFKSILPALLAMSVVMAVGCAQADDSATATGSSQLQISSPAFKAGKAIPKRYSCQGENVSPPLEWSGVPAKAKSLAIIVHDPDSPSGSYTHWVVYNLPADSDGLDAGGDLPGDAAEGKNGRKQSGYTGMCPPTGQHRYVFKLYALDTRLDLDSPDRRTLRAAMKGHIVGKAKLTGLYEKQ